MCESPLQLILVHKHLFFYYLLDRASLWWLKNKKPTRCHLLYLLCFLDTQHVSGINMSIFRSFRLCCWTTTFAVLFLDCCVMELGCGSAGVVSGLPTTIAEPHPNSNTQQSKKNRANVVVQQHSRKLLKMDILMPETCWVCKKQSKYNKWHLVGFWFFNYLFFSWSNWIPSILNQEKNCAFVGVPDF